MDIISIDDFDIDKTINAGETFIWEKIGEEYIRLAEPVIILKQNANNIEIIKGNKEDAIKTLGLLDNIKEINESIDKDKIINKAIKFGIGLRVIQDGEWIAKISFLLSIASNIRLIRKRIKLLSYFFGRKLEYNGKIFYLFPKREEILRQDYRKIITKKWFGFRYKFIINAVENSKEKLGIGPKVNDCIELYGKHNLSAFPIDTWIKRVIKLYYPRMYSSNYYNMRENLIRYFGKYAGYAQLYLYYFIRHQQQNG